MLATLEEPSMSLILPAVIAAVVLLPPLAHGQDRASFTGTWTMVPERSESPAQTPPVNSIVLEITHADAALNVNAKRDGKATATSYPIDNTRNPAAGTVGAGTTRAYWEGRRLVAWRAGNVQGQTVSIKETYELTPDASELIVETTVEIQHGYTMKGAKNYASSRDVFRKTS
jgi:hypothetical protein